MMTCTRRMYITRNIDLRMYPGVDENGKTIHISILHEFIVVMTFESNGLMRKNVYHRDGTRGKLFEERWKE